MMAPTPGNQHIWESDAESFSVAVDPIKNDVEEEVLDAEEEKKEDDEEGTVKEKTRKIRRLEDKLGLVAVQLLPNPSDTRRLLTLRIKWTFHVLSSIQSKL